jgi:alkylation response protein AidB-like acyl-CoA dehydrogenase
MAHAAGEERERFRSEVESWFEAEAPRKGTTGDFSAIHIVSAQSVEEYRRAENVALDKSLEWQRKLYVAGLSGRSWPEQYGGRGAPAWQDDVVAEVQSRYGVSTKVLSVGLEMLPPVLVQYGTDDQCRRYLPSVLSGTETWCQLLSEPDAGSDLGSATTFAAPAPGGWTVSGQKVWTSGAGTSDFALLIARTDRETPGMAGLSCLILDMSEPGVDVRPLRQMSGAYHFNEVFLEDVHVPHDCLIGKVGQARQILRTMLTSERAAIGGGTSARSVVELIQLAKNVGRHHEPGVRQTLATAYIREKVLDLTQARIAAGTAVPAAGSITKLMYSEHARLSADAGAGLLGPALTADVGGEGRAWRERLLFAPGLRIGGGTDEIQRNTIAERALGLPR